MEDKFLRIKEVCDIAGVSKREIYRRVAKGTFPQQRRVSHRCAGWSKREVMNWLDRVFA
ncbi:helix-turn-helix transcriptional regulator [Manganibacter manganicus]|uniref:helix-turn-helix transcriptional regulator n=1 Tax=Manganibacter manganicus TaxID=1873176 RepID=UPI0009BACF7E|nr:AlpA family phage regulatory protein [Pseudaminobacter manganicus]